MVFSAKNGKKKAKKQVSSSIIDLSSYFPCHLERFRSTFKQIIIPLVYHVRPLIITDLIATMQILASLEMNSFLENLMKEASLGASGGRDLIKALKDVLPESELMPTPLQVREWVIEQAVKYMHKLNPIDLAMVVHDANLITYMIHHEGRNLRDVSKRHLADVVLRWMEHHRQEVLEAPNIYWSLTKHISPDLGLRWNTVQEALFVAHLSNRMRDEDMMEHVAQYLARRMHFMSGKEALEIPYDVFYRILSLDDMSLESEDAIYELVSHYIAHNEQELLPEHMDALMSCIRSAYLSDESSVHFFNSAFLSKSIMQRNIIMLTRLRQGKLMPDQISPSRNCLYFNFKYQFDGDHNGILYYMGLDANRDPQKKWMNPFTARKLVSVYRSVDGTPVSVDAHPPCSPALSAVLRRPEHSPENIYCKINDIHAGEEIFILELNTRYSVKPTSYSICFENIWDQEEYQDENARVTGGWILEAAERDPQKGGEWVPLREHEKSVPSDFRGWKTWSLPQNKIVATDCFFRFFRLRILQPADLYEDSGKWSAKNGSSLSEEAHSWKTHQHDNGQEVAESYPSDIVDGGISRTSGVSLVGSFCVASIEIYGELKYRSALTASTKRP